MNFWDKVKRALKRDKIKQENGVVKPKISPDSKRKQDSKVDSKPELIHIPKGYEDRFTPEFIEKNKKRKKAKRRAQRKSRKNNRK